MMFISVVKCQKRCAMWLLLHVSSPIFSYWLSWSSGITELKIVISNYFFPLPPDLQLRISFSALFCSFCFTETNGSIYFNKGILQSSWIISHSLTLYFLIIYSATLRRESLLMSWLFEQPLEGSIVNIPLAATGTVWFSHFYTALKRRQDQKHTRWSSKIPFSNILHL